jgi:hypothetical protein
MALIQIQTQKLPSRFILTNIPSAICANFVPTDSAEEAKKPLVPGDERREFLLAVTAVEKLHVTVLVLVDAFADDASAGTVRAGGGGSATGCSWCVVLRFPFFFLFSFIFCFSLLFVRKARSFVGLRAVG